MGDIFLEEMVKKRNLPLDYIKKALIWTGGIILCFAGLYLVSLSSLLAPVFMLIAAGGIYFAWYFATGLNLEFEYIYTNGEIDFDKISAKRKRKRMITLRISSFEDFGEFHLDWFQNQRFDRVLDASACRLLEGNYYATFHDKEGKSSIIIFTPGGRLLKEINPHYRRYAAFQRAHAAAGPEEGGQ